MKKILLLALLVFFSKTGFAAGSANVTIINNCDFVLKVVVYGYAPSYCGGYLCSTTYITDTIMVPVHANWPFSYTTWGPSDPCAISSFPGWITSACSFSYCSSVPSDFQWTFASINMPGLASCWSSISLPLCVEDNGIGCTGSGSSTVIFGGCGSEPHMVAYWSTSGGSLADITVEVDQW